MLTSDEHNFAAAQSAIFIVAFYLVHIGLIAKSIVILQKSVPYLGFDVDAVEQVLHFILNKKMKFSDSSHATLDSRIVSVKMLQRIVGKCVSFSLAVPAAQLFTQEMNAFICRGLRTLKSVALPWCLM